MGDRPETLGLDKPFGPGVFGKSRVSEASTFALEKIAYSGGRSEYGLAQPRAAGFFIGVSGTFALEIFPL